MHQAMIKYRLATLLGFLLFMPALTTAAPSLAIVLAHGKQDAPPYAIDPVVERLRARGVTVVTPDMPWSAPRNFDADHESAIMQIVSEVQSLRATGVNEIFIGGHGLGGNTALAAAARVSVRGVVLIAAAHTPDSASFAKPIAASLTRAREMIARGEGARTDAFLDSNHQTTREVRTSAAIYASYFEPGGTAAMSLSAAKLPRDAAVLWLYGTWDVLRDEGEALFFARLPAHPATRRVSLLTPFGNTPAKASALIEDWLFEVADR